MTEKTPGIRDANRRWRAVHAHPNEVPTTESGAAAHHFTVDVEEYFQVAALSSYIPRYAWEDIPSRIDTPVNWLLDLLAEHDARGTFFVLGWVAERRPDLVRRIAVAGHEVASHGQAHRRVTELFPAEFRWSVSRSKHVLEDITGQPVLGYRAPSYSINVGMEWALEILVEEGYRYDSSLFPVRRNGYGYVNGPRNPYSIELRAGNLMEFPPATARVAGRILPAAGGAYLRLLPYRLIREGLRQAAHVAQPATFYIHPWELDPEQPRLDVSLFTRIRHYGGLRRTEQKVRNLLSEFRFQPVAATVSRHHPAVPQCDRAVQSTLAFSDR